MILPLFPLTSCSLMLSCLHIINRLEETIQTALNQRYFRKDHFLMPGGETGHNAFLKLLYLILRIFGGVAKRFKATVCKTVTRWFESIRRLFFCLSQVCATVHFHYWLFSKQWILCHVMSNKIVEVHCNLFATLLYSILLPKILFDYRILLAALDLVVNSLYYWGSFSEILYAG